MGDVLGPQVLRLYRLDGTTRIKAFADISIGDFVIKGLRVVDGKKGLFLGMPQEKSRDGKWYDTFYPSTPEAKQVLLDTVLAAYQQ